MVKPSLTGFPIEEIFEAYREMGDGEIFFRRIQMTYLLSKLHHDGDLSDIEMVVADMLNYSFVLESGAISVGDINEMMARREDVQCISVPYWYLEVLTNGFKAHADRNARLSLGKAMNLEGTGRGSRKRIENIVNTIRDLQMCELVLEVRARRERSGNPISLEDAYAEVSSLCERQNYKVSEDVIGRAFKRYGARAQAVKTELLIGGATS
jgi:hypothetical protein